MRKADEARDPNSCFNRAGGNEPIFVLRGNDEIAPGVVRKWAERYRESKGKDITARQAAKADEALQLAEQMERWKAHQDPSTIMRHAEGCMEWRLTHDGRCAKCGAKPEPL